MGNIIHTVRSKKINLTVNIEHILQCTRHGSLLVLRAALIETHSNIVIYMLQEALRHTCLSNLESDHDALNQQNTGGS